MVIGVVSDSHGDKRMLDKAFNFFKEKGVTHVFHLGDYIKDVEFYDIGYDMEVITVPGNMDSESMESSKKIINLDNINFLLCHGHTLDVRNSLNSLVYHAKENNCKVALYGHTHMPFNNKIDGIIVINPGSISKPRGGTKKSLAIIKTSDNIINAEIFLV